MVIEVLIGNARTKINQTTDYDINYDIIYATCLAIYIVVTGKHSLSFLFLKNKLHCKGHEAFE